MVTINEAIRAELERAAGLAKPKRQGMTPKQQAALRHEMGLPCTQPHDDGMYWTDELGTPELPETIMPKEGNTMTKSSCSGQNSKGKPCQASPIPGTAKCRYHTATTPPPARRKIIVVRRKTHGAKAIKAVVDDSVKNGTLIDVSSANYGRGEDTDKPRWFNNWRVAASNEPSKYLGCHDVVFKDGKRIASRNIWHVRTTVPVQQVQ